jgi:threonylcarbamoyladenosine tRNA methylthiotransferase MtaB
VGLGIAGTVAIETHGCKLNQSDSEALARRFRLAGYEVVGIGEPADVFVLDTCTVTHVADRKARHALRAAALRNPRATIIATGCYAQRDPHALTRVMGVNMVVGNSDKARLVEMVLAARGDPIVACATGEEGTLWPGALKRTRAMIKIQEGCNQVCSYCIVPKVRGRERSIPPDTLVKQIKHRVCEGYQEVVLTGTQLGSYGFDLDEMNLYSLIRRILSETGVRRLRVSSLQAQEISQPMLELWRDPRLCPHFHLPLQSGSDSVLSRMRRRYSTHLYASVLKQIRSRVPGASVTSDIIVGFPGESAEEFEESLSFAESMEFGAMHVFPYSTRPGTGAAHMDRHIKPEVRAARMERMLGVASAQAEEFRRKCIGSVRPVLWEQQLSGGTFRGLTDNYIKVVGEAHVDLSNRITAAFLASMEGQLIRAEVLAIDESPTAETFPI